MFGLTYGRVLPCSHITHGIRVRAHTRVHTHTHTHDTQLLFIYYHLLGSFKYLFCIEDKEFLSLTALGREDPLEEAMETHSSILA